MRRSEKMVTHSVSLRLYANERCCTVEDFLIGCNLPKNFSVSYACHIWTHNLLKKPLRVPCMPHLNARPHENPPRATCMPKDLENKVVCQRVGWCLYEVFPITWFMEAGKMWRLSVPTLGRAAIDTDYFWLTGPLSIFGLFLWLLYTLKGAEIANFALWTIQRIWQELKIMFPTIISSRLVLHLCYILWKIGLKLRPKHHRSFRHDKPAQLAFTWSQAAGSSSLYAIQVETQPSFDDDSFHQGYARACFHITRQTPSQTLLLHDLLPTYCRWVEQASTVCGCRFRPGGLQDVRVGAAAITVSSVMVSNLHSSLL